MKENNGKARTKVKAMQSAAHRQWGRKNEHRCREERTVSVRFLFCSSLSTKPTLKGFEAFKKKEFFAKLQQGPLQNRWPNTSNPTYIR
jgi:hypothetical protein